MFSVDRRISEDQSNGGGGGQAAHIAGQPHASPREEGADLTGFTLAHAHLLLVEVYGDHLHHNKWNPPGQGPHQQLPLAEFLVAAGGSFVHLICYAAGGHWQTVRGTLGGQMTGCTRS